MISVVLLVQLTPSCSTSDFSCSSNTSSCDESLIVENELLKNEVTCLTNDLRKCYGQMAKFNHCWGNQKFSMNKEGLGYIPKKGRAAFVHTWTTFVKASGVSYCENCKNLGHDEKNCTNKKAISFDPRYVLFKKFKNCVSAKFVGILINGAKKNAIWVPKALVSNIQGPKKIWVPKRG